MPLSVLSIDLDWFNHVEWNDRDRFARKFFRHIFTKCRVPEKVYLFKEHHYMYPWCINLIEDREVDKVEIFNVDEHHDFYFVDILRFLDRSIVHCGNFFAFMAHDKMIQHYHWFSTARSSSERWTFERSFIANLRSSNDNQINLLEDRFNIYTRDDWGCELSDREFDAISIIKSPKYTLNADLFYKEVKQIICDYNIEIDCSYEKRYKNFSYSCVEKEVFAISA